MSKSLNISLSGVVLSSMKMLAVLEIELVVILLSRRMLWSQIILLLTVVCLEIAAAQEMIISTRNTSIEVLMINKDAHGLLVA